MEGIVIIHTTEMENSAVITTSLDVSFDIAQVRNLSCPLLPQFYPLLHGT